MAVAAAAALVPFVVGFGLTVALATDDKDFDAYLRATVTAVMIGLVVGGVIGLMNTPSTLANAEITPDKQWVVFRGGHPAFAAEMTRMIESGQRADGAAPMSASPERAV
jgi:hypothetical protein